MERYELEWNGDFSSAHKITSHAGKCKNIHGHNWQIKINITVEPLVIDPTEMIIDFGEISKIIDTLDHKDLNEHFKVANVTAEFLVGEIAQLLYKSNMMSEEYELKVIQITLEESAGKSIIYTFHR